MDEADIRARADELHLWITQQKGRDKDTEARHQELLKAQRVHTDTVVAAIRSAANDIVNALRALGSR